MTLKLSLGLAALLCATLSLFLWNGYSAVQAEAARRQDERLREAWAVVAEQCADGWTHEGWCTGALRAIAAETEPAGLRDALILDAQGRIVAHTDFFRGDDRLKGATASTSFAQAAVGSREPLRLDGVGSEKSRMYSHPIGSPERLGTVIALYRERDLEQDLRWVVGEAKRRQLMALLLGGAIAVLAAFFLGQSLLDPLGGLVEGSRRVAAGDFKHRIPEVSEDELGELAKEFNRMTARLAEIDELKEGFVAQITHDLRAPLSGMLGQADLLLGGYRGPLSPPQEDGLKALARAGRELAELIDNILDVTKLEAGAVKLEPMPVDVEPAVEAVVENLGPRAQQTRIELVAHVQPELTQVLADAEAFRRVLTNLVSNAVKFTPAGGQVTVTARNEGHREAVFCVSDTGVGIPPHRLGMLFKKFSQVPEVKKSMASASGSGLGLAICKQLVEASGGRIWAESEEKKGTRFYFTLPTFRAEPEPARSPLPLAGEGRGEG